jgi:glucosamine 6-phosphate synthetase-like amidotransferase/phosphosugar isomerase protein
MSETESNNNQEIINKKKFDRKEYMKNYMKKRYYEKPEVTKELLKQRAIKYHEKTKAIINADQYGLDKRDVQLLRTYYKKVLLLRPDAIEDILLELGVPEMQLY